MFIVSVPLQNDLHDNYFTKKKKNSNPTLGPGTATFCFSFSLISEWPANVAILIGGRRLPERGRVGNCSADNESPSRGPCGWWSGGEHESLPGEGGGDWGKSEV